MKHPPWDSLFITTNEKDAAMELIDQVISDIRKEYEYSIRRIERVTNNNYRRNFGYYSGLRVNQRKVLTSWKPLRDDYMHELESFLEEHPNDLKSDVYPKNILEWIG